jgi:hypothetical protein
MKKIKSFGLTLIALALPLFTAQAFDFLTIYPADSPNAKQIKLDDVKRITFDGNTLAVETFDGNPRDTFFALEGIGKIIFKEFDEKYGEVSVQPVTADADVIAYIFAGELVVESSADVKLLTLFSIDGKILQRSTQSTMYIGSLPASVYILQINTEQGSAVRKIIKQ